MDSTPNNGVPSEDDQDDASVNVSNDIDLELTKVADVAQAKVGDIVTFTLTLTNQGPADATNVDVYDLLPLGVTHFANNPSTGTYNPTSGTWKRWNSSHRHYAYFTNFGSR